jgi:hypothetical protein
LIFFLQGIGQLFPWNAFISASAYFSTRFCGTRYASSFETGSAWGTILLQYWDFCWRYAAKAVYHSGSRYRVA